MKPYFDNGFARLYQADARALPVADQSVHCVVTSPPYFGLRDYQLEGDGIGLEPTLSEWMDNIVAVGREVWRVLRNDGTWWLNLGDAYAGSGKGPGGSDKQNSNPGSLIHGKRTPRGEGSGRWGMGDVAVDGLPAKSLMMQPQRAALALQDDGWIVRSEIVWHKPNPMPESVSDRPTSAHEKVYLLVKQPRYFYDAEAVRQAHKVDPHKHGGSKMDASRNDKDADNLQRTWAETGGANLRNVWMIPTQGRPDAHFASFPDHLPELCILAGTSERGVCADCGAPWMRQVAVNGRRGHDWRKGAEHSKLVSGNTGSATAPEITRETVGWQPTCECGADTVPATVLDPFIGRGSTAIVAQRLGRRSIGVDMNPDYLALARKNIEATNLPLL